MTLRPSLNDTPKRGQSDVWEVHRVLWTQVPELDRYLDAGWEPFAVTVDGGYQAPYVYLRRKVDAEGNSLRDPA